MHSSSHSHGFPKPTSGSSTSTNNTSTTTTTAQQQTEALQKILAASTSSSTTTALARKIRGTHVWKINNFSMLPRNKEKPITSPNFVAGEALWTVELYPFGVKDDGKLSIFVRLLDMPDCDKDKPFLPVKYRFRCVSLTGLQDYAPIDWEQRNWLLDHEWGYLSLPREAIYEYAVDDSIIFVLDLEVTVGLTITHITSSPSIIELRTANQDLLGKDMSTLIRKGIRTDVKIVLRQSCSDSLPSSPTPITSSSSLARASLSPTHNKRRRIIPETGGKGTLDEDCWEWEDGEDVVIPAHKLILSMRSPIFHAMFHHDMKENAENILYIDDMDRVTLCRMLDYIYTSNVHGHPSRDWIEYPRSRFESGSSTTTPTTSSATSSHVIVPVSTRYEQGNASSYIYNTGYPNTNTTTTTYPYYYTPTSTYRKRSRDDDMLYTPPISTWDDVMNLFRAADKYCLEGLSDWCGHLIGKYLTKDNVIATLQLSDRYRTCPSGSSMIKRVAKEYLMSCFDDVINAQHVNLEAT